MGKNVQVTASTGIAAQNMQSKLKHFETSTVHKFFALKDNRYENDELVDLIMSDENFSVTKKNHYFCWNNYHRWDFHVEFKVAGTNSLCNEISAKKQLSIWCSANNFIRGLLPIASCAKVKVLKWWHDVLQFWFGEELLPPRSTGKNPQTGRTWFNQCLTSNCMVINLTQSHRCVY